jgi:hypothetical protein
VEKKKREKSTGGIHSAPANDRILSANLRVAAPLLQAVFSRRGAGNSQFTIHNSQFTVRQARVRLCREFSRTCEGQVLVAGLLLSFLLLGGRPQTAYAQEPNRAGLVVVDGAGVSRSYCVDFAEAEISGYELLQRAGLALGVEASAMGATICAIDGEGCSFPAESCFCQCQGSPCVYWSYWTLDADGSDDGWRYETMGAGNARVRAGDVQGWRWGAGTVTEAQEPPLFSLDEICREDETVTPTAMRVAASAASTAADELVGAATPLPPVVATRSEGAVPAAVSGLVASELLIWLGVLAVPLVLGGWLLWRRRRL